MEFTDRDMALNNAATDTNEEIVKTIIKHQFTQDEFNGLMEPERHPTIKRLLDHYCAIHDINTGFYLSTPE